MSHHTYSLRGELSLYKKRYCVPYQKKKDYCFSPWNLKNSLLLPGTVKWSHLTWISSVTGRLYYESLPRPVRKEIKKSRGVMLSRFRIFIIWASPVLFVSIRLWFCFLPMYFIINILFFIFIVSVIPEVDNGKFWYPCATATISLVISSVSIVNRFY